MDQVTQKICYDAFHKIHIV